MKLNLPSQLQQELEALAAKANKTPEELGIELLADMVRAASEDATLLGEAND